MIDAKIKGLNWAIGLRDCRKLSRRSWEHARSSIISVNQLDAGPIHYVDPFLNQIKIKNKLINC